MIGSILYRILYVIVWLFSLLPLRLMYLLSDLIWLVMFACPPLRYRRKIVQKNLRESFPDRNDSELRSIERRFYRQFLDQIFETVKMASMGRRRICRHMTFSDTEVICRDFEEGRSAVLYLGHTGNWEWISSLPLHFDSAREFCQVYHPLENRAFDRLMLKLRGRYSAQSIPMEHTLRRLLEFRRDGKPFIVGMIADQVPLLWNIHYFTRFMNHDTPVFTGSERIARKMDLAVYYCKVTRVRRGYYNCRFIPMFPHTADLPEYAVTEKYMRLLEENICEQPYLWLWTHNRWKRTRQDYLNWLASVRRDRDNNLKQ